MNHNNREQCTTQARCFVFVVERNRGPLKSHSGRDQVILIAILMWKMDWAGTDTQIANKVVPVYAQLESRPKCLVYLLDLYLSKICLNA